MTISRIDALRVRQIQLTADALISMCAWPPSARIVRMFRDFPVTRGLFHWLIGYRRPFATLAEAELAIRGVANEGHENPEMGLVHLRLNAAARPSDYPVLLYLSRILTADCRIFDLGGSVGNIYYCYREYLDLPDGLTWIVNELPGPREAGQRLAQERQARQLRFSGSWQDANGCDVLIASGSAHYFAAPLGDMIAGLSSPPPHVFVNRMPLQEGPTVATAQDGHVRVACMIYNAGELIRSFERAGYTLVDRWKAYEASLFVPGYPEHAVPQYSGMYFCRRELSPVGRRLALVEAEPPKGVS